MIVRNEKVTPEQRYNDALDIIGKLTTNDIKPAIMNSILYALEIAAGVHRGAPKQYVMPNKNERDFEIVKEFATTRCTKISLAKKHGISPTRITEILRRAYHRMKAGRDPVINGKVLTRERTFKL